MTWLQILGLLVSLILSGEFVDGTYEENFADCYKMNPLIDKWEHYYKLNKSFANSGFLQTPNYPNKYPKNTYCIYNIRAPDNYKVQLKSSESFNIEPSHECKHDYLEIRDGKYGYSKLIGRFCNSNQLQLPIQSETSSLWIKFYSDDTIQLTHGFKLEFKFVRTKSKQLAAQIEKACMQFSYNLNAHLMNVHPSVTVSSQELESYVQKKLSPKLTDAEKTELFTSIEYTIILYVEEHKKVFMNLQTIEIEKGPKNMNNCSKTYFEVYDGTTSMENRKYQTCSTQSNKFVKSETNALFVRFKLKENITSNNNYFNLVFNAFKSDSCSNSSFRCADGSCIERRLRCDGVQSCLNNDDESACTKPSIINSIKPIKFVDSITDEETMTFIRRFLIILLGVIIGLLIIISVVISCRRSLKASATKRKFYQLFSIRVV